MALNTGANGAKVMRRAYHESRPPSPSHNPCGGPVRHGLVRDVLGTEPGGTSTSGSTGGGGGAGSSNAMTRTNFTNLARSALEGVRRPSLPSSHIPGLDYIPIMQ